MSPDDLFEAMFGNMGGDPFGGFGGGFSFEFDPAGGAGSRKQKKPKPARGKDTDVGYEITMEEAYKGKRVVMMLERDRLCAKCKG
jgi:DnaJ family protein A protein 2